MVVDKMQEIQNKEFSFEVKDANQEEGTFSGYASTFGNIDRVYEVVAPGAFSKSIDQFMKDGIICWAHDWSIPIGKPTKILEDEHGLFVEGKLSNTSAGRDALVLLNDKVVTKMSIGYRVKDSVQLTSKNFDQYVVHPVNEEEKATAIKYGRVLTDLELLEFSPVSIPANNMANILSSKSLMTLDDHSEMVLTTIDEYLTRLLDIKSIREGQNKPLSKKHLDLINGLLVSFGMVSQELMALLPAPVIDKKAALLEEIRRQHLRLEI